MEDCDLLAQRVNECSEQGKYEEAIDVLKAIVRIYQQNGNQEGVVACFSYIGSCYMDLKKYHEAVENYQHCLPIMQNYNINEKLKGWVYVGLGHALQNINNHHDAREYLEKALEIAGKIGDRNLECDCYLKFAQLSGEQEQFQKCLQYAEQCIRIALKNNLPEAESEGHRFLGNACLRLGRTSEAIGALDKYLQHIKQGGDRVIEARVLFSLSECYLQINEYDKSAHLAQKILSIAKETGSLELECLGYRNIGTAFREKGKPDEAMEYHKKQLASAIKMTDKEQQGSALNSLGNVCFIRSKLSEAMGYFHKCAKLYTELGRKNALGYIFNNLGLIYQSTGQYHEAAKHFEQCLSISQTTGERSAQEMAYHNLSNVYGQLGKVDLASEYEWKSIIIAIQNNNKRGEIFYLQKLGQLYNSGEDFNQAIKFLNKALKLSLEMDSSLLIGDIYTTIAEAHLRVGILSEGIDFYQTALKKFKESGNREYEARCLSDLGSLFYQLSHGTQSQMQNIQMAEQYLRESLQTFEGIFDDLKDKHDLKISIVDTYVQSFKKLTLLLIEQNRISEGLLVCDRGRACALDDILILKYGMDLQHSKRMSLNESDLQTCLVSKRSSLVFCCTLYDFVYFWVLSQQKPLMCVKNESKDTSVTPPIAKYISQVVDAAYQSIGVSQLTSNASEIVKEPLKELFRVLITPVQEHLTSDEIVIVPEGPLYRIPFAALQDPQTGRYLCELHRIRITPSLTTLKILKEIPPVCSIDSLVVGSPYVGEVMFRGEKITFPELPAAEIEAGVFGFLLDVSPLIGKDATKDAVKAQLKDDAAIIHIAAHGDNDTGGIVLAPGISAKSKPIPEEEDYILTMQEVQEIGVRAKLVVLSCCDSGRGEIHAEGVVGMARAFLAAGAHAVVASLWAISDEATLDFMSGFYTHLKYGESASESLNESMKELIREKTYSHPKYWAPFVLIGDDVTIF